MKTLSRSSILALGMLAVSATFAQAADTAAPVPAPVPAMPHPRVGPLRRLMLPHAIARQLGLSADQIAQMKAARSAAAASLHAIRADTTLTPEQKRARVHETIASARQQMHAVLTPEQQAKLQELRQQREAHRAPGV